jgi:hypothetical protein
VTEILTFIRVLPDPATPLFFPRSHMTQMKVKCFCHRVIINC